MKPKTKKTLKLTALIIGFAGLVGTTVAISTSWDHLSSISFGGSSSVLSLINELSKVYQPADIVATAGGSGAGINAVLANIKEIGMASKDPGIVKDGVDVEDPLYKKWAERKIKTMTIAWDGIVIVYKPAKDQNPLILNEENVAKIYASISGVKTISFKDLGLSEKTNIIPFARNGGAQTSGTADAFWKDSNLKFKESKYWKSLKEEEQKKIENNLKTGEYPETVFQTAESNSQTWDRIKNEKEGALTYLSAGFVFNHKKEIEDKGFKVAQYKGNIDPSETTVANGYNWFRPFNLMFSLDIATQEKNKKIKDLINWIYQDEKAKKIISDNGYINLNEKQINSMKGNENSFFSESALDVNKGYSGAKAN